MKDRSGIRGFLLPGLAGAATLVKMGEYLGRGDLTYFNPFSVSMVMPNSCGANIGIKHVPGI